MKKKRRAPDCSSPNPDWLDARQIAYLVGHRSLSVVDRLAARYPDFPAAVRILHSRGNRRWPRAAFMAWMERHLHAVPSQEDES